MKYTELVQSRLTKDQLQILEKLADAEGLSLAGYIRRILIKEMNFAETGIDGWPIKEGTEDEEAE